MSTIGFCKGFISLNSPCMNTYFTRLCLCVLAVACTGSTFAYTTSDCDAVQDLVDRGIVNERSGCGDYGLDRSITRQEVAAIGLKIAEVCGTVDDVPEIYDYDCQNIYSDVSRSNPNEWACRAVEILSDNGIISQARRDRFGDLYFRPLRNITRAEALSVMLDSAGLDFRDTIYDDWRFSGTGVASWQKPLMQYALDEDIIGSIASFGANQYAYRKDVFRYTQEAVELCTGSNNSNNNNSYTQCGVGSYRSGGRCNVCDSKPANSRYTTRGLCDWTCNSGYSQNGNSCIRDYNTSYCAAGQYASGNTCYTCNSLPSNGYYTTAGSCDWSCNSGYYKSGNSCVRDYNYNYFNDCALGEYKVNNSCYTCSSRPSNSHYNYAGSCDWSCNSGFRASGGLCVRDTNQYCSVGQYYSGNTCLNCTTKPSYAYYTSSNSCDWSCESGYYKSGNSCISNYNYNPTCSIGQYSSGNTCYWCNSAPSNAYYITNGSCDWSCNSGYYKSGNSCVSNYTNYCGVGQYSSGNTCYACTSAPWNAYYLSANSCDWSCNSGYVQSGNTCVSSYNYNTCGTGQYLSGNTCYSCGTVPANGYYTTAGSCDWSCNSGYYKSGNSCVSNYTYCGVGQYTSGNSCYACTSAPWNGYYTTSNSCDWSCISGYYKSGNTCVSSYTTTCSTGQYLSGNSCYTCNSAPSNAYYTTAGTCDWSCSSGYTRSGNTCVSNITYCGVGQYVSGNSCYSCTSKPANSYYTTTGTCDYSCNAGYVLSGNSCIYNYSSNTYYWYSGTWSGCGIGCASGTRTRIVECRSSTGAVVADWYCSAYKPHTSEYCN